MSSAASRLRVSGRNGRRRLRSWLAGFAAFAVVFTTLVGGGALPAQAADYDPASLRIFKSVTVGGTQYDIPAAPTVEVGEEFLWNVTIICDYQGDECVNAMFTDVIPDEFEIVETSINSSIVGDVVVDGQTVTIAFQQPLTNGENTDGEVGLSASANISIPVKLRPISQDQDGEQIVNTASVVADNAPEVSDPAQVTAHVPLVLGAEASKSFDPTSALVSPGGEVGLTFGGTNTSNGAVDRLVVQDPANPSATPNIFQQYLQIDSLGAVTWPAEAETATVSVTLDGGATWLPAPEVDAPGALALPTLGGGATTADITGIRIEFAAANPVIPQNATTSVQLALSQRGSVSGVAAETALANTSSATVGVADDEETDTANANFTLRPARAEVTASKSFSPDEISVTGDTTQSTVTLGAVNSGTVTLSKLSISEPTDPSDRSNANMLAPEFGDGNVTFAGFGSVTWPQGATAASVTYYTLSGAQAPVSTTTVNTLPEPVGTDRVTGFRIDFTGEAIVEGAEATVPFTVQAPDEMTAGVRTATGTNEITVSGETPPGSPVPNPVNDPADDDLTVYNEQITIATTKALTHDELPSTPGQTTTAQLTATVLPYPLTSTNPTQVIIDDPQTLSGVTTWYEYFDATAITLTQIPQNATLTIRYRNAAGVFVDIPGMTGISGATDGIYSAPIPSSLHDDITGIRFIYENPAGFTQNQTLKANVTFTTRGTERTTGDAIPRAHTDPADQTPIATLENCSAAEASAVDLNSGRVDAPECPELTLNPTGPGDGPGVGKDWTPDLVFSHSRQNTTATLNWSAGLIQGTEQIIISDMAADETTGEPAALADSAFDAFNLTRVGPIDDPNFEFDQIAVQIWDGNVDAWVNLSTCTFMTPCSGTTIPAIVLTTAQQQAAEAVRFIITEKQDRDPQEVTDPLPGTGITTSTGNRQIPLTLQLRDTLRSDATHPVVEGPLYNTVTASQVLNTTSLDGWDDLAEDPVYRGTDSDTINIIDTEIAVSTTKSWSGAPVAIPQNWGSDAVPTTRVTVGVTNETAGDDTVPGYVNELRLIEPGAEIPADKRSPFDAFDLLRIHGLTAPNGTTAITVQFDGTGSPADVTGATAAAVLTSLQALPEAELRSATGVTVIYTGAIPSGETRGTGTLVFDLELRETLRGTSTAVTTANSPVRNTVLGTVTDKRWDETEGDFFDETFGMDAGAQVTLQNRDISVTAGKTFNPVTESEPNNGDITMTLSGKPGGSERAKSLTLTDDRATFWNAYEFQRTANTFTLPTFSPSGEPILVEYSVCTGRDWSDWADGTVDADATCAGTDGSWSDWTAPMSAAQAQAWSPLTELGIDPQQVEGLMIRFTRTGDAQWENPQSPTVNLPVVIQRLDSLRSGGDVPSTLVDGGAAAPGEPVKGVTTNTVTAEVEGIWGGTASQSQDATITYAHATNAVEVRKDPIGTKNPGAPFDYTLTVRNTGDRDIVDPVITDRLPWDSELGTLVQFNPDASETTPRYAYTLSGANPSAGAPMPTDPTGVTVTEDLESSAPTIAFEFPSGTRLAPGQTYTIVFKMMFVPGVQEGQAVVNAFDIVGDRVWDECTAPSGHTAALSPDATECSTEALVTPQRLPSIRTSKSVRVIGDTAGAYNDHGFVDAAACVNRVDGDDFVAQPCVPRSMPGQSEEWRLTVTNNGTTPLTRVAVADLLPTPGDTTLIAGFNRNSQWTPTLSDTVPTMGGTGLAGATLTTYVTTAAQPDICMATINDPSDLSCIDETGTDTSKFVPFASLADKSTVTALLFVVDAPAPSPLDPGAVVNLGFETRTGPYSQQTATADPGAFNSLTVSALYPEGTATRVMTARDQSRVGVALITGSVEIAKTITGPAADFVPDGQEFAGTLQCTSQGVPIPDRSFTVVAGTPTLIEHLPAGAICTATETAASGQTSYVVSGDVTVPSDDTATVPTLTITNTYELTELVIRKQVTTDADQFPTGFEFEVECTFLGEAIDLASTDASFTLDHDGEHTVTGLPVNAECTITETEDRGADSTSVEAESLNADGTPHGTVTESGDTAIIDGLALVDPDAGADPTGSNVAEFTNSYGDQAALRVEKDLVGGGADLAEDLSFDIHVLCIFEGETLLDRTLTLNRGNGWGQTLPSLVADAECTITESDLNGADAVLITPNDGTDTTVGELTIPDDATEPVLVTVTNRYLAGSLEVTKSVTGDGAALYGTGDFTVELACTLDGDDVRVIDGAERTVSASDPLAEYTGLPSGAECTLIETDSAGATESQMRLAGGTWVGAATPGVTFIVDVDATEASNDDQAQTGIEVENRFDLAEVSVTKLVETDAVDAEGIPISYGPFDVELVCTFVGDPVTVTDAAQTIADGETAHWVDLPAGAECEVTETGAADADETWYLQAGADPDADPVRTDGSALGFGALNAIGDDPNEATLVNRFDSTTLTIAKVLGGNDAASADDKTFEFSLVCTLTDTTRPDGAEVWNGALELSAANDWLAEIAGLATGAECVLTETADGGADRTTIAVAGEVVGGTEAQFTVDATELSLTVTNTFRKALVVTGGLAVGGIGLLVALLMLGGAILASRRRRLE